MFADLERYKALERDIVRSSIINQFSGLVYVPALTTSFSSALQTAGTVTINVDNATCTLGANSYSAYFIPGYITEIPSLSSTTVDLGSFNYVDFLDDEYLITHIETNLWYPNNFPDNIWGRLRQSPFGVSYLFHIGTSKVYSGTLLYHLKNESGLITVSIEQRFKNNPSFNNNTDVVVLSSSLTYSNYTPTTSLNGLDKNTVINYVKRFPNRLI